MPVVHVLTPGDHFSPRTGSAIPTVVDGLCRFAPPGAPSAAVAVARGTYADRYDSAAIVEYQAAAPLAGWAARAVRVAEPVLGRLGLPRLDTRRVLRPSVGGQGGWPPGWVIGHNMPQLVPTVDAQRHRPVLYVHNDLLRTYSRGEAGRVLDRVAAVLTVSAFMAERTAAELPLRLRSRVHVVPNGVDFERFRAAGPHRRSGMLRVAFIGRVTPEKGPDLLIEAVRLLGRADLELTLIGSRGFTADDPLSPYERDLRRAAAGMAARVRFVPFVPRAQVPALLADSDVVVVPSRFEEPFGLTVLEAMASHNVVVGARIGGIPEAMGGAGILVEPGNPRSVAEALAALLDDEQLLDRLAAECQARAARQDWAVSSARFHEVLAGLDG
nr:glycosyltransferase family 4 protein [Propionibacterium sp.]